MNLLRGPDKPEGFTGFRRWLDPKLLFLPLMLFGMWALTRPSASLHPLTQRPIESADVASLVASTAQPEASVIARETAAPEPTMPPQGKPLTTNDIVAPSAATPAPRAPATVVAPPPPDPQAAVAAPPPPPAPPAQAQPTAPPTLSPAAQARQARARDAQAALNAPLVSMAVEIPTAQPTAPAPAGSPQPDLWLLPGMSIAATLYTSASTDTATAGTIVAYLKPPGLFDATHRHLIAPAYAKLIGTYGGTAASGFTITQNQSHLPANFSLIEVDDRFITLGDQPGIDPTGTTGLGATVDRHTKRALQELVAVTAIGALLNHGGGNGCGSNCGVSYGGGQSTGAAVVQAAQTLLPPPGDHQQNTLHVAEGAAIGVMITQPIKVHEFKL